ncbi:noggin [Biomphalaria glabrata]
MILLLLTYVLLMTVVEARKTDPRSLFALLKPGETHAVKSPPKTFDFQEPVLPDVNVKTLKEKLGSNFDTEFMSVEEPSSTPEHYPVKGRTTSRRPNFLKLLTGVSLGGGHKLKLKIDKRSRRKLTDYLRKYTACAVEYTWKKLGKQFFPQWFKKGRCPKRSCSIPPGMSCTPKEKTSKRLLHWRCEFKNKNKCDWTFREFSVVTKCACTC